MANNLITPDIIANEFLRLFGNTLVFPKMVNRTYENQFGKDGAKVGDTVRIRIKNKFTTTDGRVATLQDTIQSTKEFKVDKQKNITVSFTSVELTMDLDDFSANVLQPIVNEIANKIDMEGLELVKNVYNTVGKTGEVADTLMTYLKAGARLDNSGVPRDGNRKVIVGPLTQAGLVDNLKGLFNQGSSISSQNQKGIMGESSGFMFAVDQNVYSHKCGSAVGVDTIEIDGAAQTGAELTVTGLTNSLTLGDTFTIEGVYGVNDMSKQSTGLLQQFVVTEAVTGGTSIKISPEIVTTGVRKNVSNAPANDANLVFIGTAGKDLEMGVAFHKDAFGFACVPLAQPKAGFGHTATDPDLGLSIRVTEDFDIINDVSITRFDVLYGWNMLQPELACKIVSDTSVFDI